MEISEIEAILLDGLLLFPMQKGNMILTMFLMNTDKKRWSMIDFLANNQYATEEQIMDAAYRIANRRV